MTPLRIGLVGAGAISNYHFPAYRRYQDRVRLVAVAEPVDDLRRAACEEFGATGFGSIEEMLERADLDAVDICSPHYLHARHAIAAAEAGKHVLIEKPLACSMEECRAIVGACASRGVTLMVAQNLRHVSSYMGARALIAEGRLGRIWSGRIEEFLPLDVDRTPVESVIWYNDLKLAGGGVLITQSTHHIDLFRGFIGEVEEVSARTCVGHPNYRNGAEDSVVATLAFANGCHVQLCASNSSPLFKFYFSLAGEQGVMFTRAPETEDPAALHQAPAYALLATEGAIDAAEIALEAPAGVVRDADPFVGEILHFAECCASGREPISSGRDNLGTMAAVFALYESARRSGAWVRVDSV